MIRTVGQWQGQDVREATLESSEARLAILNYGAVIRDWRVAADGREVPCVLGFESFDPYPEHSKSFGIIAGRVANRIGGSCFTLDGEKFDLVPNEGANHLHGGPEGLGRQIWRMDADGPSAVILSYTSPDGEMGYPGRVEFAARFVLDGPRLSLTMTGRTDRPTPVNLAQHNYYNLNGQGDVRGHVLEIAADQYTPVDDDMIPTGAVLPVGGTRMDFRTPVQIGERDEEKVGIDLNLILNEDREGEEPAASLWSEDTGLELKVWTDQPGLQVFNAPAMNIAHPGHDGAHYGAFSGVCLEAQGFPDAVNHPDWPSIISTPDQPYHQELILQIAPPS